MANAPAAPQVTRGRAVLVRGLAAGWLLKHADHPGGSVGTAADDGVAARSELRTSHTAHTSAKETPVQDPQK